MVGCAAALVALARPAAAETLVEVTAALSVGQDLRREGPDDLATTRLEARPALVLQRESERVAWRAGYLFSGGLALGDGEGSSYANHLALTLGADLDDRTTLAVGFAATQGDAEFRLSQRPAAEGEPAFRAPESPAMVTTALEQTLAWQPTARLRLTQAARAATSAPQDDLGRASLDVAAPVGAERVFQRDELGVAWSPRLSVLRRLTGEPAPAVRVVTNTLAGSWNHDFDPRWNAQATAGVEHVNRLGGDTPSRIQPAGTLVVRYFAGDAEAALEYRHGATASLETGAMTLADEAVLRGIVSFGRARQLAASTGWLRSRPLAGAEPARGDAVSGDVGLFWDLSEQLIASARYSVAYQFDAGAGVPSSLVHVAVVSLAARWGNSPYVPPVSVLGGGRVDGGDSTRRPEEREGEAPPER